MKNLTKARGYFYLTLWYIYVNIHLVWDGEEWNLFKPVLMPAWLKNKLFKIKISLFWSNVPLNMLSQRLMRGSVFTTSLMIWLLRCMAPVRKDWLPELNFLTIEMGREPYSISVWPENKRQRNRFYWHLLNFQGLSFRRGVRG